MPAARFPGGLALAPNKQAAAQPIRVCPLPGRISVPLLQHAGEAGEAAVQVGARVARGQPLSRGDDPRFVPVHAPCAGRISAIEVRPLAHPGGLGGLHVEIEVDHDQPPTTDIATPAALDRLPPLESALGLIRQAGVAGLGGAVFPTHDKLAQARDWLIINGAECEPYIACDDRLLRERAAAVVKAAREMQLLVGARRACIAIEAPMVESIAAVREALEAARHPPDLALEVVAARYPQGGERQLIQAITGHEVPRGGLPRDIGILVLNVATAIAASEALRGRPLTHRLVSVAGSGVTTAGVFEVAIGTPIGDLIAAAGGYNQKAKRLVMGGPMMGLALDHDDYPVTKACNSILVLGDEELSRATEPLPCIRCGDCADACPAGLLPQQLFFFSGAGQTPRLLEHGLDACIECGCCDYVCPSRIALSAEFRFAKQSHALQREEQRRAELARQRFEQRNRRLQAEAEERARRMEEKRRQVSDGNKLRQLVAKAVARRPDSSDAADGGPHADGGKP